MQRVRLTWSCVNGGPLFDGAEDIVQTSDGGYLTAGYTNSGGLGGYDFYIVKFSSTGTALWSKVYGSTGG